MGSNKKQKLNLASSAVLLMLTVLFTVVYSFAWFLNRIETDSLFFSIARIDSKITVYQGNDFNQDGVLDVDESGAEVYSPLGDSVNGKIIGIKPDGEFIYDNTVNISINIKEFLPTQIYTYKFYIKNSGDADSLIMSNYNCVLSDNSVRKGMDVVSVTANDQPKLFFANSYTFTEGRYDQNMTVLDSLPISCAPGENTKEFIIKIEYETLEKLNAPLLDGGAGSTMTQEEYQSFQGKKFSLSLNIVLKI